MSQDSTDSAGGRWSWNRIKQVFGTGGAETGPYEKGRAAEEEKRYEEAAAHYRAAIAAGPANPEVHYALAAVLKRLGNKEEALAAYRAGLAIKPDHARMRVDLGLALMAAGRLEEAQTELELARALAPELMEAHHNLGILHHQLGQLDLAIASIARALEIAPDHAGVHSNLLFILNYSARHSQDEILAEHRRFGARHVQPVAAPRPDPAWPRRLRIGYVSPDFRSHVVTSFMLPVFAKHDRERFEVFGYYTYADSDELTEAMRGLADNWLDCAGHSDEQLAAQIRADRIDILVDLAGHTVHHRLGAFALRPAPLQVTYLGYPNTTGLTAIDFRLTDAKADPEGSADRQNTERLIRLPRSFLCFRPGPDIPALPARHEGGITFGCFNNFQKLSDPFFDAAAQILNAVPDAKLLLKAQMLGTPAVAERVRARFATAGIDAARLELLGWEPSPEGHLATYKRVDIALDSFPYNGTTTTCEAFWMGVPVIALEGDRHASRVGASLLESVGLKELLAHDREGYVRIAVELARDRPRLATLRAGMQERMRASALRDERGFVRELEAAYTGMWQEKLKASAEPAPTMEQLDKLWDECHAAGEGATFIDAAGRALGAGGTSTRLWFMVGCTMEDLGRPADAAKAYGEALALDVSHAKAANNLGTLQEAAGDLEAAARSYDRAIAADPNLANALYNRATLARQGGRLESAESDLLQALSLDPQQASWLEALAEVRLLRWRLDEAEAGQRAALALEPASPRAHFGLGNTLMLAGRTDEAEASFRRAIDFQSDFAEAHGNLLLCLHYRKGADGKLLFDEHRAWAARHADGLESRAGFQAIDRTHGRRLNIGYVSPNFHRHSVASFFEPLLAAHDRARVRVFCYSAAEREDDVTARLKDLADGWRDIRGLSSEAVARQVREDRIDILVDLAGHTGGGRPLLFARRPAPVQVSWLGYPNTSGLAQMDYRLTDAIADPEGEADKVHSEKLLRLPGGFLCFQPEGAPEPGDLPAEAGGRITFGCFNNIAKVTPEMVAAWSQLLLAVPGARLMLKAHALGAAGARNGVLSRFSKNGIDADRLQLLGPEDSSAGHLGRYREVDIALDTYPYNGTTTTCEALWMGVPVVTLAGPTHVTRVGASLLSRIGLEKELVAASADEYVAKASALAADRPRLAALRRELRGRMRASPLMDGKAFARSVEAACTAAWDTWLGASDAKPAPRATLTNDMLRLHVGGKEKKEGWKVLNIQPGPDVDFIGSCTDLGQFADGAVAELYASHVLEHLGYKADLPRALQEFRRVLRPGGKLMVSVPDFSVLCRMFVDPRHTLMERYSVMRMAFGGQMDAHDFHYVGLDFDILSKYLFDAGFSQVERIGRFNLFDDDSLLEYLGQPISLNLVATR